MLETLPFFWPCVPLSVTLTLRFPQPKGGRIEVMVINHLEDEVMKVFKVDAKRGKR
jgi:hypothetical protein